MDDGIEGKFVKTFVKTFVPSSNKGHTEKDDGTGLFDSHDGAKIGFRTVCKCRSWCNGTMHG